MNRYLLIILLLSPLGRVLGQQPVVQLWDTIAFREILPTGEVSRTLEDYRGKVVILDFWNIWCPNCIAAMPKLDSLQREFTDDLKIICVTKDPEQKVKTLFQRLGISFDNLSFVMNDSLLSAQFPYKSVPHHVWLDREGQLLYNTYGYNLTRTNIQRVLQGDKLDVLRKVDGSFDLQVPLPLHNGFIEKGEYSFFLDSFLESAPHGFETMFHDSTSVRYRGINILPLFWIRSMVQMKFYNQHFGGRYAVGDNLFEFSQKAREVIEQDREAADTWKKRYVRSYERKADIRSFSEFSELLRIDFERYFDVQASWQPAVLKVWRFSREANYGLGDLSGKEDGGFKVNNGKVIFKNATVADFIRALVMLKADKGYNYITSDYDIRINGEIKIDHFFSLEDVKLFLSQQGILLEEETVESEKLKVKRKGEV
ncbi:TlpA family protein disulfide reductase [Sphingobacterium faecale]|uniref:TlpA family protein disulfide reductase n=1 Tax=Sphingobacterium faecale TaxID=2803775 RepID=A0ABS1R2W7_9SPHI|nr:TlpA disulfide reductase family protein [Sphingobacterium faecale]MBL1409008.1 TlpA family protein disulfide reductase [Sphingobacterium faecale]